MWSIMNFFRKSPQITPFNYTETTDDGFDIITENDPYDGFVEFDYETDECGWITDLTWTS